VDRIADGLARLRPHLRVDEVAITGSLALRLHVPAYARAVADVDLVARTMDAVASSVAGDFLVSHYHVAQPGVPKSLIQLVHAPTRLRIDVFPDLGDAVARARLHDVAGARWRVVSSADLLTHKLRTLDGATAARPVDVKHWHDAVALAGLHRAPPPPRRHLGRDVYATDVDLVCDRCARSADPRFALAPKRTILDLLGYV
jgi:hypothetical protein